MVSLTEPHDTARETPARGSFAASGPGLPLGVLGGRGAGVGAESGAPREAVKSHSGEAIRGSWPVCLVPETGRVSNSKSVPKAWPCWPGSAQASGAPSLPSGLLSSSCPLPPPGGLSSLTECQPSMEEWPLFLLREEASIPAVLSGILFLASKSHRGAA